MRINHDLTIDRSGDKAPAYEVFAPVYFVDERWRINRGRPWHHLRYHSSTPTRDSLPGQPVFETLHLLTVEQDPEIDYFLPHEGHSSEDGWPKVFAFCLELSISRWRPQAVSEVLEVRQAKRNITKRRQATSWTRRDFLSDTPLGVYFAEEGTSTYFVAEMGEVDFREIPVAETKMELQYRRWASNKANRANRAAAEA